HLHFVNHFRYTFHDLVPSQQLATSRHELRNGLAVASSFEHKIRNQCYAFWIVELDAPGKPRPRNLRCNRDHQLVFFAWREVHGALQPKSITQQDHIFGIRKGPPSFRNSSSSLRRAVFSSMEDLAAKRATIRPPTSVAPH